MTQRRIGPTLQEGRQRARLKQHEVASAIGARLGIAVSDRNVGQWERGEHLPDGRDKLVAHFLVLFEAGGFDSLEPLDGLLLQAEWPPLTAAERAEVSASAPRPQRAEAQGKEAGARLWFRRMIQSLDALLAALRGPERYGMVGATVLAGVALAALWLPAEGWQGWEAVARLLAGLWGGTLLLVGPPSHAEGDSTEAGWWNLKVARLSGVALGLCVAVGLLLWLQSGLAWLWGRALPRPLLGLLAWAGVAFAYGAGLEVQFWQQRRWQAHGALYRQIGRQMSVAGLIAQALMVGGFHLAQQQLGPLHGPLFVLTPFALMVWEALRPRRPA